MAKAQNASTVGVHLANTVIAELDRRAGLVGYTRSKYAAALITRWYARGAEPVLAIESDGLSPVPLPDGGHTYIGAKMKPGYTVTAFADAVPPPPREYLAAEEKTPYRATKSSHKQAG